jgi:hypothetical protein
LFGTLHENIRSARSGECPDCGRRRYVAVLVRLQVPVFHRNIWSTSSAKETEKVGTSETFLFL